MAATLVGAPGGLLLVVTVVDALPPVNEPK
jgi:hypothetical protein